MTSAGARAALAGATLALAVAVAGMAPPAAAYPGNENTTAGVTTPPPPSGPVRRTVKTCRMYANNVSFGMRCGLSTLTGRTIQQILGGDPVPGCWHEPLPADLTDEYAELLREKASQGERGAFYLKTCMKIAEPEVTFSEEIVFLPEGEPPTTLTRNQRTLVAIEAKESRIPMPTIASSPSVRPRVMQDVAFRVVNDTSTPTITDTRSGTKVEMRARLVHLRIIPMTGAAAVGCSGGGVEVTAADTRTARPDACWYRFPRSSAAEPGQTYPVRAIASWTVEYSTGGVWTPLATIEKQQTALQPVTEVQTMVVS
ncbi:MAG: hypothetical protein QG622_2652 [Actinomycetota bacterium]|nr:hypothetical protein [Actinomycetota bacterium]